jgi:hypothetical protein
VTEAVLFSLLSATYRFLRADYVVFLEDEPLVNKKKPYTITGVGFLNFTTLKLIGS